MTPRILVDSLMPGQTNLDRATAHHVQTVLRLGVGDELVLFDGRGRQAVATITHSARRSIALEIATPEEQAKPKPLLTLAMSCPRAERADVAVEKLTELGVDTILWLHTEHSSQQPARVQNRHDRFLRVAEAAAKQCGRAHLPTIEGPVGLLEFVAQPPRGKRYMAHFDGIAGNELGIEGDSVTFLVGPEGGFSDAEVEVIRGNGVVSVRLGPWILRTETAATTAASLVMARVAAGQLATPST